MVIKNKSSQLDFTMLYIIKSSLDKCVFISYFYFIWTSQWKGMINDNTSYSNSGRMVFSMPEDQNMCLTSAFY